MATPALRKSVTLVWTLLLLGAAFGHLVVASTEPSETQVLLAFKQSLIDKDGNLDNWKTSTDPCTAWTGVFCVDTDYPPSLANSSFSHVTELRLLQLNLGGQLVDQLGSLPALKYLDVMWNHMTGDIPASIGNLSNLNLLLLNGNQFTGVLPSELGNLSNLIRIQIDENSISGEIPDTFANLTNLLHMHMNNNSLNGSIPPALGTLPQVVHILLDNNRLTGTMPKELANAPKITIIQLDNNPFDFGQIPTEYGQIPSLLKLSLRNCALQGSMPNFTGSLNLENLDLSNNALIGPITSAALPVNLTSIDLSYNGLSGAIPENVGNLSTLQSLELRNNQLSGVIPVSLGTGASFSGNITPAVVLDFQNNSLQLPSSGSNLVQLQSENRIELWLAGNPSACSGPSNSNPLCIPTTVSTDNQGSQDSGSGGTASCSACNLPYVLVTTDANHCRCSVPITVDYRLKSPSFTMFDLYEEEFRIFLAQGLSLSEDQVQIQNYVTEPGPRILLTVLLFPTAAALNFNQSEIDRLYTVFAHWQITDSPIFGPAELIQYVPPGGNSSGGSSRSLDAGAIAGIVIGSVVVSAIGAAALMFIYLRRRGWNPAAARKAKLQRRGLRKAIKVAGVTVFSFEELVKATDNFNQKNVLGQGGYGKVYFGVLEDGQKVAVKRAEEGSRQGANEFETEIMLLSRVHHRNLLALLGYCNDDGEQSQGEQMLVYEYIPNGNLRDHLEPSSKMPFDVGTRLRIALGSARGIHYLHTEANPPIFHRDIKATNILIDDKYNAKVADFGLSKLAPTEVDFDGANAGHISTVVKGTPGYLDPEYFLTRQLTDKSDVYSFGVVLLELATGMAPISQGKNIVRVVNSDYAGGEGLNRIVDPRMGPYPPETLDRLIRLALSCCLEETAARPSMSEVMHELDEIWKEAPWSDVGSQSTVGGSTDFRGEWPGGKDLPTEMRFDSTTDPATSSGQGLMSTANTNIVPR